MSRIDELIQKLCPSGVEYVTLLELLGSIPRGRRLTKAALAEDGQVPVYHGGLEPIGFHDQSNSRAMTVMVINTGASSGTVGWSEVPFWCSDGCFALPHSERVESKYLYYFALSNQKFFTDRVRRAGIPTLAADSVLSLRIPVPPLEVQCEIVRVLDKFTQLEAELEAELEARRTQYEHYRTEFLTFGDDVPRRPLREVATIGTGSHDTKDATPDGEFIFYARGREPLRLDSYDFDEQAIITAGDGVGVGKVFHFADGKYALHQRAYRVVPGKQIDSRFIYHYLVSDFSRYLERTSVHASVTSLRRPMFLKYPVPVPPRAEQERIVATLDKLDALVNDISIGLPGELVARRKQYEHYRDRLLTFKELPA
ncbi:MAG: restriction endonuclease subunit S [Brevibacterium aurantiacum]